MKVKMNETVSRNNGNLTMGQEYDLPDDEAENLVNGGVATDPSGKFRRKPDAATPAPGPSPRDRQLLDRQPGTPVEKLPSSIGLAGHPYAPPDSHQRRVAQRLGELVPPELTGIEATNTRDSEDRVGMVAVNAAPLPEADKGDDGRADGKLAGAKAAAPAAVAPAKGK